jgi:hypothetical protein
LLYHLFRTRVYNLEVEDSHTYYAGELGVWVHNNNCAEPGLAEELKRFELIPGPNTNYYTISQAKNLLPPHKGIILVEENTAGLSQDALEFQAATEGAQADCLTKLIKEGGR